MYCFGMKINEESIQSYFEDSSRCVKFNILIILLYMRIVIVITKIHYHYHSAKLLAKEVQCIIAKAYAMTESIRKVLSPLLIISYVCGLRIVEFSVDNPKQWFSLLYILLFWTLYIFFVIYKLFYYIVHGTIEYIVCNGLHLFTSLISIAIGVYYDKVRNIA